MILNGLIHNVHEEYASLQAIWAGKTSENVRMKTSFIVYESCILNFTDASFKIKIHQCNTIPKSYHFTWKVAPFALVRCHYSL